MTRWKREGITTLILMHEHNQWSRWYDALMSAASEYGLLVGFTTYRNSSGDRSVDKEWYVSTHQVERIGGMQVVQERARLIHEAMFS